MVSILKDRVFAARYMQLYCIPFFKAHPIGECLRMIDNPHLIDNELEVTTTWLAQKLAGMEPSFIPEGIPSLSNIITGIDEMLLDVHSATPDKPFLRSYVMQGCDALPGTSNASVKGKKSKLDNMDDALSEARVLVFKKMGAGYVKLQYSAKNWYSIMLENGGDATFGWLPLTATHYG